ncbi:MAG TPA: hypothetical protein VMV69_27705 [Pirellulales bacterium]|nr:hypothetical protein [Pirellulales bacterium]
MSQLTVSHLFDTFQSLQSTQGPRDPARFRPLRPDHWVGEKLGWLSSAERTGFGLIGADDLAAAVRGTFDSRYDRVLGTSAMGAAAESSRELRFDGEHRLPTPAHGADEPATEGSADEAAELLTQGLGLALARDALGGDHWIVVVLDLGQVGAGPSSELLAALTRLRRFLIVCCDQRESSAANGNDPINGAGNSAARLGRASAPPWFDRVSSEKGLAYLGPVGGVELDGLLAVLEALKAIEQPTILHLRLRRDDAAPDRPAFDRPAAPNGAIRAKTTTLPMAPGAGMPAAAADLACETAPGPDQLAHERRQVLARRLTPTIRPWVERYAKLGKRGLYLWKWCFHGLHLTALPCVAPQWRSHACETKFLGGMLNVLVDDVSDQQANGALLEELLRITAGGQADLTGLPPADRDYANFTAELWRTYWDRAREYPFFEVYHELLRYDLAQLFNTVRYSQLLKHNLCLLNLVEHDHYSPQGMGVMTFATLDLMCSPGFQSHDLGRLREAVWHAQWMARIGNMLTTWRREIADRDYTSGVFARAVAESDLTVDELCQGDPQRIQSVIAGGDHERHYLRRWSHHRDCLRGMAPGLRSFDLGPWIEGFQHLLLSELGSRGDK